MSTYGMSAINCTNYPSLQSNPDIDGIGVLLGFIITSYATFVCCAIKVVIDFKRKSPLKENAQKCLKKVSFALEKIVISFGDQQLVTGISLIIAGFTQLNWGVDSYHWDTIANLAWFSAFTHTATLIVLRSEERFNQKTRRWRVLLMGILNMLLIVVLYPVGYITSVTSVPANLPAWCLYNPKLPWYYENGIVGYNWLYMALTFAILLFAFLTRVLLLRYPHHLSETIPYMIRLILPRKLTVKARLPSFLKVKSLGSRPSRMGSTWIKYKILRSIYAVLVAARVMFTSMLWELTWLLLALAWGTTRIFVTRETGGGSDVQSLTDVLLEENIWAFGQVLTIALLFLPIISFIEAYSEELHESSDPTVKEFVSLPSSTPNLRLPTSSSPNEPKIREAIINDPWYPPLVVFWYLLALEISIDAIYTFPGSNGAVYFADPGVSISLVVYYLLWFLLDFAFLWIPTLIFMDEGLQEMWRCCTLGEMLGERRWRNLSEWGRWVAMGVLFGVEVFWNWWIDYMGIGWIDNLEYLD